MKSNNLVRRFKSYRFILLSAASVFLLTVSPALQAQLPLFPSFPVRPIQPPFSPPIAMNPDYEQSYDAPVEVETPRFTDPVLQRSIQNQFRADKFLRPFGIHVAVRDGIVTLTGTADGWQDYFRAETDAYAAGALVVDNQLRVRFG